MQSVHIWVGKDGPYLVAYINITAAFFFFFLKITCVCLKISEVYIISDNVLRWQGGFY